MVALQPCAWHQQTHVVLRAGNNFLDSIKITCGWICWGLAATGCATSQWACWGESQGSQARSCLQLTVPG